MLPPFNQHRSVPRLNRWEGFWVTLGVFCTVALWYWGWPWTWEKDTASTFVSIIALFFIGFAQGRMSRV